ncbi:hypothetical protein EGR_08408 [Echinococcus granulosus]|uniref:Uncharacterized protein n=1 Tax=Echinococcus granulosus TaxID=6210 RepID=W6U6F0_ECHGR|nr:hypothetical protein EGR_08408 [Echinococcus granulosus]EUB56765.1 hypothetical protein EGR_08408 [Echinococcus granulosus]
MEPSCSFGTHAPARRQIKAAKLRFLTLDYFGLGLGRIQAEASNLIEKSMEGLQALLTSTLVMVVLQCQNTAIFKFFSICHLLLYPVMHPLTQSASIYA